MKTIQIEIPNGKKAEWVNGVLTLVDERPKLNLSSRRAICKNCLWAHKHRNWLGITYYKCIFALYDITMPWALCGKYESKKIKLMQALRTGHMDEIRHVKDLCMLQKSRSLRASIPTAKK